MLQYLKYTFGTFQERKLRSVLTMIGIFIGIAMIVTLISLGQGLKDSITGQFQQMGTDKIMISPGSSFFGVGTSSIKLTDKDLETIRKVSGVKEAAGMSYKLARVKFKSKTAYTWLIGLPTDKSKSVIDSLQSFKVSDGRSLGSNDKFSVLIGSRFYEPDLVFDSAVNLRDRLIIEGKDFSVVGEMGKIGNPQDDSQLYIPLDTFTALFNEKGYGIIYAQVSDDTRIGETADRIKKELRKERDVKKGQEDFSVETFAQLLDSVSTILNIVQAVLIGLATISLVVGGVGIMNTMFTSILERTREIGIMKAVGAKNSSIVTLFLLESGAMGLAGGIIGTAVGILIGKIVEFAAFQLGYSIFKISFSPGLIIFSILFSFTVGAIAGVLPAIRASKLRPVEALRYE